MQSEEGRKKHPFGHAPFWVWSDCYSDREQVRANVISDCPTFESNGKTGGPMTTTYRNSKGELKPIDSLPYPHLKAARDKLVREANDPARCAEPNRQDEIDAMTARIEQLDAEYAEKQRLEGEQ